MINLKKNKLAGAAVPYEDDEQITLFRWVEYYIRQYPELKLLFHIPNGEHRHKATAIKLQKMGVKSGVPDIQLPVARGGYHGLFIELKRIKGSITTDNQKQWIKDLREQGYYATVCKGWEEAWRVILLYLNSGK